MNKEKKYYYGIDCLKLICSFLVVSIHTTMFHELNPQIYNFYHNYITRFAVPFFFLCSGFFFAMGLKLDVSRKELKDSVGRYFARLIRPFLLWGGIYFIISLAEMIVFDNFSVSEAFASKLHLLLVESPGGGLWYVEALLWILVIIWFSYKGRTSIKLYMIFFATLFLIQGLWSSVDHGGVVLSQLRAAYYQVFLSERSFIFYGIYFFIGFFLERNKSKIIKKLWLYVALQCFLYFLFAVFNSLMAYAWIAVGQQIAKFCISVCWFLIAYCIESESISRCWLVQNARLMSTIIYFTHFLAIYGMKVLFKIGRVDFNSYCTVACIFVSIILFFFASILIRIDKKRRIIARLY